MLLHCVDLWIYVLPQWFFFSTSFSISQRLHLVYLFSFFFHLMWKQLYICFLFVRETSFWNAICTFAELKFSEHNYFVNFTDHLSIHGENITPWRISFLTGFFFRVAQKCCRSYQFFFSNLDPHIVCKAFDKCCICRYMLSYWIESFVTRHSQWLVEYIP